MQHSFVIKDIGVLELKRGAWLNTRGRIVFCSKSEKSNKFRICSVVSRTAFFICSRLDLHLLAR